VLLDKLIEFFISNFLLFNFVLNVVIVLNYLLALAPELLDQFIDELRLSFQLLFLLFADFVSLNLFFLKLLFAGSHKFLLQVVLIFSLSKEII